MVSHYVSFKATVDAEMPTPRIEWSTLAYNPAVHDFHESAYFTADINGATYNFVGGCVADGDGFLWHVDQRQGSLHSDSPGRSRMVADGATWPEARAAFAVLWEAICETERAQEASRRWGAATMVRSNRENDARLSNVVTRGDTWRLVPAFDADVGEYTATSSDLRINIQATKKFPGQTLAWRAYGTPSTGTTLDLLIPTTSTVGVTLTVTSENGMTTKTYTFAIRKVA